MFQNVPKSLNFCTSCSDRGSSLIRKYPEYFFAAETSFSFTGFSSKASFFGYMWTIHSSKEFDRFLAPRLNEERDVHFEDLRNEIAVAQSIWPGGSQKSGAMKLKQLHTPRCKMLTHLTATVETWDTKMTISRFSAGSRLEAPTKLDGLKNCFPKSLRNWYSLEKMDPFRMTIFCTKWGARDRN